MVEIVSLLALIRLSTVILSTSILRAHPVREHDRLELPVGGSKWPITDAPLLPHQLDRLARRIALGVGRSGSIAGHGSGDIFLAFSTANAGAHDSGEVLASAKFIPIDRMDPLFDAVIQSVDEAVLNALVANETMTGADDHVIEALPHDEVRDILESHGRLADV